MAAICAAVVPAVRGEDAPVDFNRDIRPILSDHCYQCHGYDDASRQADLRFDVREDALQDHGSGPAIVPHRPEQSELVRRIFSDDEYERMPPPDANKPLTDRKKSLLKRWIAQGAQYDRHWAFAPIVQHEPPQADGLWPRNAIDAFVLARQREAGLTPSPEADGATLIRRLSQDLLGLVPSPDEVDRFLADRRPDAYERLVDRLLASPHYGERWGRHWLDQARYADSHGFTIDGPRDMWPYRDWVIAALNEDMPFDQFTIEQLAGDLLPDATKRQKIASAFHRNTMINQEGGVKPDQYRHEAIVDRVNTTGAVWLGLTIGCAQCHTHKFDPISHDDYYRLYAFFNAAADANNIGATVPVFENEAFGLPEQISGEVARLEELRAQLKQAEASAPQEPEEAFTDVDWRWTVGKTLAAEIVGRGTIRTLADGSQLAEHPPAANAVYHVEIAVPTRKIGAMQLRVLPHESLPKGGPGLARNGNFVLTDVELTVGGETVRFERAWGDHSQSGYDVGHAIDNDPASGWAINVNDRQRRDGVAMNAPHEAILALGKPLELPDATTVRVTLRHDRNSYYQIGRFAIAFSGESPLPNEAPAQGQVADLKSEIRRLERKLPGKGAPVQQMIMQDQSDPPATYRMIRGDFLNPDTEAGPLEPGVPAAVDADPEIRFENRLDLAQWLVDGDNPLTARVFVNRVWMRYFGRGLVETENDFGFQGTTPSHPQLLDWLAAEFMRGGWSQKRLHRLIVTSATYRQSSVVRPQDAKDPANIRLARQSRLRIEGEVARDQALSAAGALTRHLGGPSVFPPQPDGIYAFTQRKKEWPESRGADRFRRTMYTMFYRSAPYPLLTTFDSPDFSVACTRRPTSNTPLQALTLANDPVFLEIAARLAATTLEECGPEAPAEEVVGRMFGRVLTRPPGLEEEQLLVDYYTSELKSHPDEGATAESFDRWFPAGTSPKQAGAATALARVLINTDEFVTRQ